MLLFKPLQRQKGMADFCFMVVLKLFRELYTKIGIESLTNAVLQRYCVMSFIVSFVFFLFWIKIVCCFLTEHYVHVWEYEGKGKRLFLQTWKTEIWSETRVVLKTGVSDWSKKACSKSIFGRFFGKQKRVCWITQVPFLQPISNCLCIFPFFPLTDVIA